MRSKVARRKHKLLSVFQGQVDENVVSFADKVMIDAARELVDCQCHLIANESPDNNLRRLESINCVSDTVHRLKKLDDFINSISDRTLSQRRAFFYPPTCMSVLSKGVLPALSLNGRLTTITTIQPSVLQGSKHGLRTTWMAG